METFTEQKLFQFLNTPQSSCVIKVPDDTHDISCFHLSPLERVLQLETGVAFHVIVGFGGMTSAKSANTELGANVQNPRNRSEEDASTSNGSFSNTNLRFGLRAEIKPECAPKQVTLLLCWTDNNKDFIFLASFDYHGYGNYMTSSSSTSAPGFSTWQGNGGTSTQRGRRGNRRGDNGGDGGNNNGRRLSGTRRGENGPFYACPFYKLDPIEHAQCRGYRLTSFSYLTQHLRRRHELPGPESDQCANCRETFDPVRWQAHVASMTCRTVTIYNTSRLLYSEMEAIRFCPALGDYDKWYWTWNFLFPDRMRPQSPYMEDSIDRGHAETMLPDILHQQLLMLDMNLTEKFGGMSLFV
ncbi:hypothetical protein FDECE_13956 [Fusarium decemcellulare]|nr:hypothetical protein FDECE_13956 [Fusarium decemcellulare]